jgi:hypothetical protein
MNKVTTSPGESVSRQTTQLHIIPNSNEIAIHTNPAEEEPQTIPQQVLLTERQGPPAAAAQAVAPSHPKKPNVETIFAVAAALKKACIGIEYVKHAECKDSQLQKCNSTGDEIVKTKNSQIVAKRPSWGRP